MVLNLTYQVMLTFRLTTKRETNKLVADFYGGAQLANYLSLELVFWMCICGIEKHAVDLSIPTVCLVNF